MIKILVYNIDKIRFPFTVKRKRHGNFQRSTRNTGGNAAAAFAGATAGPRKKPAGCALPRHAQTENRQRKIPLGSLTDARGALRDEKY